MNQLQSILKKFHKEKQLKARWKYIALILSAVVFLGVSWRLAVPVLTMTPETSCGVEEHTHTEECYEVRLVCTLEEGTGVAENTAENVEAAVEGTEVSEDTAADLAAAEFEAASETEVENGEKAAAESAESQVGHVHGSECYETVLVCGMEEHTHTRSCYSNPEADVETAADWEQTLPGESTYTENAAENLLAVAKSQLGYTESRENFAVEEETGKDKGYTRYGQWYGDPYGDWNTLFVSFCLHYAGIPETDIPRKADAEELLEAVTEAERYLALDEKIQAGDLLFTQNAETGEIRVGIVKEVITEGEGVAEQIVTIETMEGDLEHAVGVASWFYGDIQILGYVSLQETEITEEVTDGTTEEVTDGTTEEVTDGTTEEVTDGTTEEVTEETEESEKKEETETAADAPRMKAGARMADPDSSTVIFYEGYTKTYDPEYLSHNFYYITKNTYTLTESFDPFNALDHLASDAIMSESFIAYCYNRDYTRPYIYYGTYYNSKEYKSDGHTHYTKLEDSMDFINSLESGKTHYIGYDSVTGTYIPYVAGANELLQAEQLRDTLTRILYYGYGGPGASQIQGSLEDAYFRRATQRAVYWYTDGYKYSYSAESAEGDMYEKLKKVSKLPAIPDNLTLNIYQYKSGTDYYTATEGLHPQASTSKASFQNLLTVEFVEKKGHRIEFSKNALGATNESGQLAGARLSILNETGETILRQWTSTSDKQVIYLEAGNYILREEEAPEGYAEIKDVAFTVGNDGSITVTKIGDEEVTDSSQYSDTVVIDNSRVDIYDARTTEVTVQKIWEKVTNIPDSVTVQLLLDGNVVEGTQVELTAENGWKYTWTDLADHGEDHEYTVREIVPVDAAYTPEYVGWVDAVETITSTSTAWETTDSLVAGQEYVFKHSGSNNAMGVSAADSNPASTGGFHTSNMPASLIWKAVDAGNGYVYLYHEYTKTWAVISGSKYLKNNTSSSGAVAFQMNGRYLQSSTNINLRLYGSNYLLTTDQYGSIRQFEVYTRNTSTTTTEKPTGKKVYQIKNVGAGTTSFSVKKTWEADMATEPVQVQLLKDGQPMTINGENAVVTLSDDNNWTYRWENLPDTGTYSATEIIPEDAAYELEYGRLVSDGNGVASGTRTYDTSTVYRVNRKENMQYVWNTVTGTSEKGYTFCINPNKNSPDPSATFYKISNATKDDVKTYATGTISDEQYEELMRVLYVYERDYFGREYIWYGSLQVIIDNIIKGTTDYDTADTYYSVFHKSRTDKTLTVPASMSVDIYVYSTGGIDANQQNTITVNLNGNSFYELHNKPKESHSHSVTVKKTWDSAIDAADIPADGIQVQLKNSAGEAVGDPVTLNESNGWTYTWTDLDENESYTVTELTTSNKWEADYSKTISAVQWVKADSLPTDREFILVARKSGSTDRLVTYNSRYQLVPSNDVSAGSLLTGTDDVESKYKWRYVDGQLVNEAMGESYRVSYQNWIPTLTNGSGNRISLDEGNLKVGDWFTKIPDAKRDIIELDDYRTNVGNPTALTMDIYVRQTVDTTTTDTYKLIANVPKEQPEEGTIRLIKVDSANIEIKLIGAQFALYRTEDRTFVAEAATAGDGSISFENIPYGDYYLEEVTAPEGYERNTNPIYLTLDANGVTIGANGNAIVLNPTKIEVGLSNAKIVVADFSARYDIDSSMHTATNKTTGVVDSAWTLSINAEREWPGAFYGHATGSFQKYANVDYSTFAAAIDDTSFNEMRFMQVKRVLYWYLNQNEQNLTNLEAAQRVLRYITDGTTVFENTTDSVFQACHDAACDDSKDSEINRRLSVHIYKDIARVENLQNMVTATLNPEQTGDTIQVGNVEKIKYTTELPKTGGMGTRSMFMAGIVLMLAAAMATAWNFGFFGRRRRRR